MGQIREDNRVKKEYLMQYRHLIGEQKDIEDELRQLMLDSAMPGSPGFEPHTPSGKIHDLSDYVVKYDYLFAKLERVKRRKWEVQADITDRIEEMGDAVERRLLRLRYIKGLSFRAIADKLGYSEDRIWHKHGDALQHFTL